MLLALHPSLFLFLQVIFPCKDLQDLLQILLAYIPLSVCSFCCLVYHVFSCCQCDLSACHYVVMAICPYRYFIILVYLFVYRCYFHAMKIKNYVPNLHRSGEPLSSRRCKIFRVSASLIWSDNFGFFFVSSNGFIS